MHVPVLCACARMLLVLFLHVSPCFSPLPPIKPWPSYGPKCPINIEPTAFTIQIQRLQLDCHTTPGPPQFTHSGDFLCVAGG